MTGIHSPLDWGALGFAFLFVMACSATQGGVQYGVCCRDVENEVEETYVAATLL